MKEEERTTHESFGQISVHNVSGYSGYLFGTAIEPNHFVTIRIDRSEWIRNLTDERFFAPGGAGNNVVEIKMSPAQFAELLTSPNTGGVPCTITEICGQDVPQVNPKEVESRKTFVVRKFKERMNDFVKKLDDDRNLIYEACKKPKLSAEDKRQIKNAMDHIKSEITSNLPFLVTCWQETMDKVTIDAKAEIDATLQQIIHDAGIKALEASGIISQKLLED